MSQTTTITTGKCRASYCNIFVPKVGVDGGDPKYSTAVLIPKSDTVTVEKIKAAIKAATEAFSQKFGKAPASLKQPLRDGDKIKFVYVRTPNPLQEDVIAFPQVLPKEFKLESYIDYDKMFEKVFLDALQIVIEPLGWKTQEESSLEDFFG